MHTIIPHEQNPALREIAVPIPRADITSKRIQSLIADMKKLLAKAEHGVALAAPQVGENLQLFIVSGNAISDDENATAEPDQVYINPTILKMSRGKSNKHEGCLSIRGVWGSVPRAEKATIRAYDEHGTLFTRGASGILAHIFQHEVDHLNGILYTDKAVELYDDEKEI